MTHRDPIPGSPDLPDMAPPRWRARKVILAYAVMFAVAAGSIWLIDGHVMKLSEELAREARPGDVAAPTTSQAR